MLVMTSKMDWSFPFTSISKKSQFIHNLSSIEVPRHINSIGYLARNFTIDDTSFIKWKNNLLRSATAFKAKVTKLSNKLSPNQPSQNQLKIAYIYLDQKLHELISRNAVKLVFDKKYFISKSNTSSSIFHQLRNVRNARQTLIESDKNMGDVYIDEVKLDAAAVDILNVPNFMPISESEPEISRKVFLKTKKLWNQHKVAMKPFISQDLDSYIWSNQMKKIEQNTNWLKIPKLRPMIKLHKPNIEWRRIINTKNWY